MKRLVRNEFLHSHGEYKYSDDIVREALENIYPCCHICHSNISEVGEVEHIYPYSLCEKEPENRWLINEYTNLLLICPRCNKAKKAKKPNYNLFIDPTNENNREVIEKIELKFNGELTYSSEASDLEKQKINYMIDIYNLNRSNLVIIRCREYIKRWKEIIVNKGKLEYSKNDAFNFIVEYVEKKYYYTREMLENEKD